MASLWDWFKGRGRANGKPVAGKTVAGMPDADGASASRKAEPRSTEAIDTVTEDWEKNSARGDQDYYHVPGANPALKDPPTLDGEPVTKPRKRARAERRPS